MADDNLHIRGSVVVPASELVWRFSRSSGPGGQSVNTSDSKAALSFDVANSTTLTAQQRARVLQRLATRSHDGVVTVTSTEERSQYLNRQRARQRLAALLSEALAPPPRPRRATKPTRASIERRRASKQRRSDLKRQRRTVED